MRRDLAGAIIAARRTYEAALRESGARLADGDRDMVDGFRREVNAQFQELATALGYLVTRDELIPDGAETAAAVSAN